MKPPLKIAFLGTRGIPANYGGFETFVEEVAVRLVRKGYQVTVYCREGNSDRSLLEYKGVRLVFLPAIRHKYLETIVHTFYSSLHVLSQDVQIVYCCNVINSIFMIFPMIFGKRVIINVDGLEWKRAKWNRLGKLAYQFSEWLATFLAHHIISDSKRISLYYKKKFNKKTTLISYGATGQRVEGGEEAFAKYGLKKNNYLLYVSRLEPENNAHIFIEAYEKVVTDKPLVIVGHAPYGAPYMEKLRSTKDKRIRFLGGIYGEEYRILLSHAALYFHGNEVGGTNPALLEAMATGNCVIANGVGFNREVVGEAGVWFKPGNSEDLKQKIEYLLAHPEEIKRLGLLASDRIKKCYNWEDVAGQYDEFFKGMK